MAMPSPTRAEYASALGYLAMASASLEADMRTLIGILLGPPYGTAPHVLLRGHQLHKLCDVALRVANLDTTPDLVDELKPLMSKVKTVATKRNELIHSAFHDSTDSWQKAPEIIKVTYETKSGGVRLEQTTPEEIDAVTAEVKRVSEEVTKFAFGRVLPLTDPGMATPVTDPL